MVKYRTEVVTWINIQGVIFANKNKFSFSIDSILLSYFSKVKKDKILIDIGAGTGIIGFRINFLNNLKTVYLIEIQKENAKLIEHSIVENKLNNAILLNKDLKECYNDFENSSVDYIVSNPPYKKTDSGKMSQNKVERISKYEVLLTLEELILEIRRLLKNYGEFFIVVPNSRLNDVFRYIYENKLNILSIKINKYKKVDLVVVHGKKGGKINSVIEIK